MKNRIVIAIIATLCSVLVFGQRKTAEDDPHWPQQIVQRAFGEVSAGLRTSWSERYLARLGDSAAPEIMKCVSGKPLTKENAETALILVKMSFADPHSVGREQNRAPANTLGLLDYLDKQTSDTGLKSKIGLMRAHLNSQASATQLKGNNQLAKSDQGPILGNPLAATVDHFDVNDGILRDGLSELSSKSVKNLHLGFEEVIRDKIQVNPKTLGPRLSLHLEGKSVRQILDELCISDVRYAWSEDGSTINVYPRATVDNQSYLLNLWIDKIAFRNIPDPDQAFPTLSKLFPEQQVGYFGPGLGDNTYAEPWTAVFERLTVRQFINRLAEHMGSRTSWVWQGAKNEMGFTFLKGGFHTQ